MAYLVTIMVVLLPTVLLINLVCEMRKIYWGHRLCIAKQKLADATRASDAAEERLSFARAMKSEFDLSYNPNQDRSKGAPVTPREHQWCVITLSGHNRGFACIVCGERAVCPHDSVALSWVDDCWICPKCGDEWPDDSFGPCKAADNGQS